MRLARYLGYRLLLAAPVILGIIVLNFFLIHAAPGDAASVLAGESGAATPEYMALLRHKFGLDQPLSTQFGIYLLNMAHFDLGYSFRNDSPVTALILDRLGPTLLLMLIAFVVAVLAGSLLGVLAAGARNTPTPRRCSPPFPGRIGRPFWMLIDCEYASSKDRAYDLGAWFGEMFFSPDEAAWLVERYASRSDPDLLARHNVSDGA
jgi:hypothetical protein